MSYFQQTISTTFQATIDILPVSTQLKPKINMNAKKLQLTLTYCYGGRLIVLKLELINTVEGAKSKV